MKILLISYYYLEENSTGSLRARAISKYLPQNGIQVTVLTANNQSDQITYIPNIISVKDINNQSKGIFDYLWRASQKILRIMGLYRGMHLYWRLRVEENAGEIIRISSPQIILATYPCIEALEIGYFLSKKYDIPFVADFRDGLMFEPLETRSLKIASFAKWYKKVEVLVAKSAKLVITICDPISRYFIEHYGCNNVLTLPNGFDPEIVEKTCASFLDPNFIHIVHTGRIGLSGETASTPHSGISALCAALNITNKKSPLELSRLRFHFAGQLTPHERAMLSPFVHLGIVILWGQIERNLALNLQRNANYLLLITAPDRASLASGKIFGYLAANKVILALTRGTEAARIIMRTGSGIVISPDNPMEIAKNLELILGGDQFELSPNQMEIDVYLRSNQMKTLSQYLKRLVEDSSV